MTEKILNFKNKDKYTVSDIAELVEILRSEDGCAWDREQTHASIRNAMIEETYEFIEGLDADDKELMQEELGDVIFQVFFHARIAEENGRFNVNDVADGICKKMVLRHPHVFGDVTVANSAEVLKNWEEIKKSEKNRDSVKKDLESVPAVLPSLIRAEKLISFLSVSTASSNLLAPNCLPIIIPILLPKEIKAIFARFITVDEILYAATT